jgi:rhomboid protease GluP
MKVVGSGPVTVTDSQHQRERLPRRWPIATVTVLAVTTVLTVLQFPFPEVRLALWRDPHALAAGQWWRLVTPLFVQYDAVRRIVVVFAFIAGIGVLAERVFGHGRWLLRYLGCGVVGQAFGYLWDPPDAGASGAAAGLLGAVGAWLLSPAGPRLARVRVWGGGLPGGRDRTHRGGRHARPAAAARLRPGRPAVVARPAPPC